MIIEGLPAPPAGSPEENKEFARDEVATLLTFDSGDSDLKDALKSVKESLGDGSDVIWTDPFHVDEQRGVDTFSFEKLACDKLVAFLENEENSGFDFEDEIRGILSALGIADRELARLVINEAITGGGKQDDINDAIGLFTEAGSVFVNAAKEGGTLKDICDEVIPRYGEAWEKAAFSDN